MLEEKLPLFEEKPKKITNVEEKGKSGKLPIFLLLSNGINFLFFFTPTKKCRKKLTPTKMPKETYQKNYQEYELHQKNTQEYENKKIRN